MISLVIVAGNGYDYLKREISCKKEEINDKA